jgi:lipopolysaccharide/colanic/teichoic acid biosynthesis glycosyltransferase
VQQAQPSTPRRSLVNRHPYWGKRALDVVVGTTLSIVTAPIVTVLAAVSAVKFRTSPFFVHERVGLGGDSFRCIKIRSLPEGTPAYLDKVALNDHCEPTGWARFLRRFHLDELPQFWHVVGGSMSLVGPRPMIKSIIDEIPHDIEQVRHSIRPGITGPWQVSVDGAHSLLDCLDYDEVYVSKANLALDVKLMALTAVQTIGLPKSEKAKVFAMMAHAAADTPGEDRAAIEMDDDPDFVDVRNAS